IATGHYVKKLSASGGKTCELAVAKDLNKDQSYFLWTLAQDQLKHCLFPIGDLLKSEVREIAKKNGLATAEKEESQGVCFIGEFNMEDFLKKYIKQKKGKIKTSGGKTVGEHNGLAFYTIGQRHGFGYAGGEGGPYYVTEKDFKKNELIVAEKFDEKKFAKIEVEIISANWIDGVVPKTKTKKTYLARIRYRQPLEKCKIAKASKNSAKIVFDNPQRAVTPGQSLVVYDGKKMLGGGIIKF
ncbi:MAG: tRNA 2-thiouridine(34) synthase MnmA, partial [Patescibacteria group bacterium]